MNKPDDNKMNDSTETLTRRRFCKGVMLASAATALNGLPATAAEKSKTNNNRKIKIGIVGLGNRGNFVGNYFKKHGGYEVTAVADYFEDRAKECGQKFGVPEDKIFSGLSGYKRVLDSGVDALVLINIPYFFAEQAAAAVDAGCHVYVAKPFAINVPDVFAMKAAADKATAKKLCFLVDYQLPLDKANQEVAKRIGQGGLGKLAHIYSGIAGSRVADPKPEATIEHLFRKKGWQSRINLNGDGILEGGIHIIDGVTWAMKRNPVSACGVSESGKALKRNGNSSDYGGVVFQYDDSVVWTHISQELNNNVNTAAVYLLGADLMGTEATAHIAYWGRVHIRGGAKHYSGSTSRTLYDDGARDNVAEFYRCITQGDFSNPTVKRSVDSTITAILGREASAQKRFLTRDELIRENKKLEVNLKGLKA